MANPLVAPTPPAGDSTQALTGQLLALYRRTCRTARLSRRAEVAPFTLAFARVLRQQWRVELRLHPPQAELRVADTVLIWLVPSHRLSARTLIHLRRQAEQRHFAAALLLTWDTVRPRFRRVLLEPAPISSPTLPQQED